MTTARTTFRSSAIFLLLVLGSAQLVLEDVPTEHEEAKKPESSGQAADPMTRMLQWGVDHTDHESLAERARAIREGRAQPTKIDREVMDALFGTKVKFLQKVVDKLLSSVRQGDAEELVEVLEELEGEITDIDNANDLDKLGGLDPVLELLAHEKREVKAAALWVVGTAAQSNPVLQELLAGKRVLAKLLAPMEEAAVAKSRENLDAKLVAKSLYAISTFVRGCKSCLEQFVEGGGATSVSALLSLLSHDSPEVPPVWLSPARKTVALIGDLVQEENAPASTSALLTKFTEAAPSHLRRSACGDLVSLLGGGDRELQEKVLETLIAILRTRPSSLEAMQAAGVQVKVEAALAQARKELAQADNNKSWDDIAVLSEQFLQMMGNSTTAPVK